MNKLNDAGYEDFRKKVGERIQAFRKEKKMTQEKLAEASGLDRVAVAYIENGYRSPKFRSFYAIARALSVSPKDLLDVG